MKIFTTIFRQTTLVVFLFFAFSLYVFGAEETATLSFANKAQRTSFSTTKQVWEQNGITLINDKASSSSNVADYANPVRFYASSSITIEAPGNITKIVFDCNSSSYATALKNSIGTISGVTTSVSSDKVTVTFTTSVESFTIANLTAQVRMDSISVTYGSTSGGEEPPITEYVVTFNSGTGSCDTESLSGEEVTLPSATPNVACELEDWEFVGWSESIIDETTEKPTLLYSGESYTPTKNITLYAVYKKEEIQGDAKPTYSWVLTDISEITPEDQFAITMTIPNGTTYELPSSNGSSSAPGAIKATIVDDKLSLAPTDVTTWTLTNDGGNYTFHPNGDNTKWLYCTNTNNGVRVGTNTNKTFILDANSGYLKNEATNRYIGIYNAQDWRCYTSTTVNIANQKLGFYVKKSSVAMVTTYNSNPYCTTFSATFHINANSSVVVNDINPGTAISDIEGVPTLLNTCDANFWSFAGWTTATETLDGYAKPEIVTAITDDVDLYPVFSNAYAQLATDASQLQVNDKIIIVAKDDDCALSTNQRNNNRGQIEITKIDNKIGLNDSVQIITLQEGSQENTFVFYVVGSRTGYLYAASSSNNYLKTRLSLDENGSTDWDMSITNSIATLKSKGTYTRNMLGYNASDKLFSCYIGRQQDVSIYEVVDATQWIVCHNSTLSIESGDTHNVVANTAVDTLILKSNKDQAAQINITAGAKLTAQKVIVEKTIDASRYYFFSLPFDCDLNDVVAIDSNGDELQYADSPTTGDYVINYYDQTRNATTNKAWVELIGTSHTLKANQGYIIGHFGTGDVTVKFPSKDAVTISAPATKTLNYTDSWTAGDVENSTNGWNLIGLPYYQSVDGSLNPTMVSIPREDGTYNQIDYTSANIQPFTSFFVQTTEAPKFTIAAHQNAAPMLRAKGEASKAVISLVDANGVDDKTTIINNPNNTNEYEIGHDLAKWIGYAARPQIYSIQGDDILAFNSRAIDNSTVIPLGVYAHADGEYTFSLDAKSVGYLQGWELYDNEEGKTIRLANETLTVYLEKGKHEGRFELRLQQRVATDCDTAMSNMQTWVENGKLNIDNMPIDARVYIYDAVGRMLYADNEVSALFSYDLPGRGVYSIVVSSAVETIAFKTIY